MNIPETNQSRFKNNLKTNAAVKFIYFTFDIHLYYKVTVKNSINYN